MSNAPPAPPDATTEAWALGQLEFEKQALTAISAPTFINHFYIQPYPNNTTVSVALGSLQVLQTPRNEIVPAVRVVGGFFLDRAVAINLAAFLNHYCNATAEEIAAASALVPKSK